VSEALLEHFNWDLSDHPPYGLGSQRFHNNEELMEGGKRG
jgi:hypothetical protein